MESLPQSIHTKRRSSKRKKVLVRGRTRRTLLARSEKRRNPVIVSKDRRQSDLSNLGSYIPQEQPPPVRQSSSDDEPEMESPHPTGTQLQAIPHPESPTPPPSAPPGDDGEEEEERPPRLIIANWLILWSVYLSSGASAVTQKQYTLVRNLLTVAFHSPVLHWRADDDDFADLAQHQVNQHTAALPSYSTIWRNIRKKKLVHLTIQHKEIQLPRTPHAAGAYSIGIERATERRAVGIVLPSQYALQDIATPAVWNHFQQADYANRDIPLVSKRDLYYSPRVSFYVDDTSDPLTRSPCRASRGDTIDIELTKSILPSLRISHSDPKPQRPPHSTIRGQVLDIFCVQHQCRRSEPLSDDITSPDVALYFQFVDLHAPSLLHLQNQPKQLLKPGDIVSVIRPVGYSSSSRSTTPSRIFLVHRFWRGESDAERHLIIPRSDLTLPLTLVTNSLNMSGLFIPLCHDSTTRFVNVVRTNMIAADGSRGAELNRQIVASQGTLEEDDEPYYIYRFLLYSDGFQPGGQYNTSSMHGVYIVPLNFNKNNRNCTNTTRVVTLTSPDVSPYSVFKALNEDLRIGITTGFVGTDANGVRRRVFLDLVGILGDTPAINYALDVLGHTASAFCHCCIATKPTKPNGREEPYDATFPRSKFASIPRHGTTTCVTRFAFRHRAIADSSAPTTQTKSLGILRGPSNLVYPVHLFANTLVSNRENIPFDSMGARLIPGILCPYGGSLISPDHLITGLAQDCIGFALATITSLNVRSQFDTYLREAAA